MISRRNFIKASACSIIAPWWLHATSASSNVNGTPSALNIVVLDGQHAEINVFAVRAFNKALMHALAGIAPEPVFVSSLGEMSPDTPGNPLNSRSRISADMVIGLVPASQWRPTLLELTKRNMSIILHGQHWHGVGGELHHEHHLISAVCDSVSAQTLCGHFGANDSTNGRWTVRVTSPTSGKPLSTIYSQDLSSRLRISEANPPRYAYGYCDVADTGTNERYVCSWSDKKAINQPGIHIKEDSSITQSNANRLYALRMNTFAKADPAEGAKQYDWIRGLGYTVGIESLRAMKKDALRSVSALPWALGVSENLPSSSMRTDIFCGGRYDQENAYFSSSLGLRSFIAVRRL